MIVQAVFELELLDSDRVKVRAGLPRVVFLLVVLPSNEIFASAERAFTGQDPLHFVLFAPFTSTSMCEHAAFSEKAKAAVQVRAGKFTYL